MTAALALCLLLLGFIAGLVVTCFVFWLITGIDREAEEAAAGRPPVSR